jgi:hypothetical protein
MLTVNFKPKQLCISLLITSLVGVVCGSIPETSRVAGYVRLACGVAIALIVFGCVFSLDNRVKALEEKVNKKI